MSAPDQLNRNFEDIAAALAQAENGRWFLAEHARRQRAADTETVLAALSRLRQEMANDMAMVQMDQVRREVTGMSDAIAQTRKDISSLNPRDDQKHIAMATEELGAIVTATEQATGEILGAAESIQAAVANARNGDTAAFDVIEAASTEIFMACSFQDITGQRTAKVVNVLIYLEERVKNLMVLWGGKESEVLPPVREDTRPDAHLMSGPSKDGEGVAQDDIDRMMSAEMNASETVSQDDIDSLFK